MKNTITFRNTFSDCDDFASYVLDSLAGLGYEVTEDLNTFLGIDLPIEADLYEIENLPNIGKNYKKFGSVRSWLYDLYEIKRIAKIKNLFNFTLGQKVIWSEGRYDYYFIKDGLRDNGMKLYTLESPFGVECGGRVREDELLAYY